jgi:hypothetical protein
LQLGTSSYLIYSEKCAGPFTVQVSRLSELTVAEAESSGTGELQVRGLRTRLRAWWVVRRGPRRLRPKACQYMNPGNRQSYGWTLAHQPCKCRHPHPLRTVHSPSSQRRTSLGAGAILTGPDPSKPSRRRVVFPPALCFPERPPEHPIVQSSLWSALSTADKGCRTLT